MDRQLDDTYCDFFENSPLAQLITDQAGIILHVNAAALSLLGFDEEKIQDLVGKRCTKFFKKKNEAHSLLATIGQKKTVKGHAVELINIQGEAVSVLLDASACYNGQTFKYGRIFIQALGRNVLSTPLDQLSREVLNILVESMSIGDAIAKLVPSITVGLECQTGIAWKAEEKANRLERLVLYRQNPQQEADYLLSKSNNISLIVSSGFPADIWFSDTAHSIMIDADKVCCGTTMEESLPGLRQIFSFPIPIDRLNWGLFAFFSSDDRAVDPSFLTYLENLGKQIGRFVERQLALENYQKLQESYSLALAGANDGIWDWDLTTNQVYFSPRYKSIIGYEDHELENHFETFRRHTHPDDYPIVMDAVHRHMTEHVAFACEIRMLAKNGDYRWVSSRGNCTFNEQGRPVRMSGSHRDITDIKEAEMARHRSELKLRESETKFKQLAENIREVFWICTADRRQFTYVSPAFEDFWGVSCADVLSDASLFFSAMDDDDCLQIRQALALPIDQNGSEFEFRMAKENDPARPLRWIRAKVFPIHDEEGNRTHLCGIASDITDKKEIEQHANQFYSTISHELRTPLTSIRAALGLIEGGLTGEIPSETKEYTTIARENCDRLIRLINDMLDIKKIEANHLELNFTELSPLNVIRKTVDSLKPYSDQSGVTIQVDDAKADHAPQFEGDEDRVLQILTNLLSNAIKYTPKDKLVRLEVAGRGDNIRFAVIDEGPGIAEGDKRDLFGPFQQLSCIENVINRGTGLGLAISKILVERMGGAIGVESKVGSGSQFWFTLPLKSIVKAEIEGLNGNAEEGGNRDNIDAGARGKVSNKKPATAFSTTNRSFVRAPAPLDDQERTTAPITILVLEDSDSIAMIVNAFLVKNGYKVVRAACVADAKAAYLKMDAHMIIADVNLPDGSGLAFVDWSRDPAQSKEQIKVPIPVIFLSGDDPDLTRLTSSQKVDWVRKPFDGPELIALVRKRLETNSPSASKQRQH